MFIRLLISNATDSPLPLGDRRGLGVRSVTMFATGAGTLEGLKAEKLAGRKVV